MAAGDPTGADLASGTTNGNTLPQYGIGWEEREITLGAGTALTNGTKYAIVGRALTATPANELFWSKRIDDPTANGDAYNSADSGGSWAISVNDDVWFKTKAGAVEKEDGSFSPDVFNRAEDAYGTDWAAQTFTASSDYTITSVVLKISRWIGGSPGTVTVSIRATEGTPPGKATTPAPVDNQINIAIVGRVRINTLAWDAPSGETPDYLVYFRAEGDVWVLQETITDDSTSHTISSGVLDAMDYYSIFEWRVDTRESGLTTTGDTWTFITQEPGAFTAFTRRSDYSLDGLADKVWQPGTGWVDPETFEYTGGGRFKGRVLIVGHKVIYFGDL